jgi:hypothetical protein
MIEKLKINLVMTTRYSDLSHIIHVTYHTYISNKNSYMEFNAAFGLGDNSWKVRIHA